jgi:putative glutathione S-transferase
MGPFPDVEEGCELNFEKLKVGGVKMPLVLDYENKLP